MSDHQETAQTAADRLTAWQKAARLSDKGFAAYLGVSENTLRDWASDMLARLDDCARDKQALLDIQDIVDNTEDDHADALAAIRTILRDVLAD